MRFAILGADEDSCELALAAAKAGHLLGSAYESEPFESQLSPLVANRVGANSWERLLHEPDCEAVLVGRGGGTAERPDQLRKLVQSGMPLVVVHPICGMLLGYELQMIQQDTRSPIVPYFPGLAHPSIVELAEICASDARVGAIRQLVMERSTRDGSQPAVTLQFARDALLFRRLIGRIDRLGALGAAPYPSQDWSNLSVHMTSHLGVIARWSLSPGLLDVEGRLSVIGSLDRVVCAMNSDAALWTLRNAAGEPIEASRNGEIIDHAWPFTLLEQSSSQAGLITDLWEDACRSVELAETIEASCRRGKTIELHHEEHSEEETFKSMMAAGGCLAMMLTLFILPVVAVIDSFEIAFLDQPFWRKWPWVLFYWRNWPIYLLVLLALFLGLQVLRLAFRKPNRSESCRSGKSN